MAVATVQPDPELDSRIEAIDPSLDLEEEVRRLLRERDAIMLAHYYQESEIQDLAHVVGDSLALAQAAQKASKPVVVFAASTSWPRPPRS